jgi:hypothetical protein
MEETGATIAMSAMYDYFLFGMSVIHCCYTLFL